jgi:hypothetical protein
MQVTEMKTFKDFDDRYTAPSTGSGCEVIGAGSCKPFLNQIQINTADQRATIHSGRACYPIEAAGQSNLHLEMPDTGGKSAVSFNHEGEY